jgi:hypothetical protein
MDVALPSPSRAFRGRGEGGGSGYAGWLMCVPSMVAGKSWLDSVLFLLDQLLIQSPLLRYGRSARLPQPD